MDTPFRVHVYRKIVLHQGQTYVASFPERKTTEAAGYDATAFLPYHPDGLPLYPLKVEPVPTGLFIAGPRHSTVFACSRSGLASKGVFVVNAPGIVDSDYRGEIIFLMMYLAPENSPPVIIRHGDRIGQFLFLPPQSLEFGVQFVDEPNRDALPATDSNRQGGFGSTGLR